MKTPDPAAHALDALARESLEACDGVLARVWTVGPGDSCATCAMRAECPDQSACLHLVASTGLTTRLDGPYRRFPLGARRVGRVVTDGSPFATTGDLAAEGIADRAWLELHRVRTFVAVPLGPSGRGVLAVFSRLELTQREVSLLRLAARAAVPTRAGGWWPDPGAAAPAVAGGDRRTLAEIQREAIERALVRTGGRISGPRGAASLLGLKPSTLASRMEKLGVRRPRDSSGARSGAAPGSERRPARGRRARSAHAVDTPVHGVSARANRGRNA